MANELAARLDAALADLPPELQEIADRNVNDLRQSIELTKAELARLLEDESAAPLLRSTAAWIIGLLREPELKDVLSRVILETREVGVVWEASKALCAFDGGGPVFRSMLRSGASREHRKAAAYALGRIGDTSSIQLLIRILSSPDEFPDVKAHAAEALGYLRDRTAFSALVTAASDPSAEVRFWSAFALGNLGDKRAVPCLEELAGNDHEIVEGWWAVSEEAAAALSELQQVPGRGN